jgi:hypothetical protein
VEREVTEVLKGVGSPPKSTVQPSPAISGISLPSFASPSVASKPSSAPSTHGSNSSGGRFILERFVDAVEGAYVRDARLCVIPAFELLKSGPGMHLAASFLQAAARRLLAQTELLRRQRVAALAKIAARRRTRERHQREDSILHALDCMKGQVGLYWAAAVIQEQWRKKAARLRMRAPDPIVPRDTWSESSEWARQVQRSPEERRPLANAREPAVGGPRGLLRQRSQPQMRPTSAPDQRELGERTEYLPFLNTISESDALTRQVERSLLSLRELLATPRRLERLEGAPRPRPLSAAVRPFVRPPNVPEVPLPLKPLGSQSSYGPDDVDETSFDSGSAGESPVRAPEPEPRSRRSQASGRGTRSSQGTQRSREEDRTELRALCSWLLRRYRSGAEACAGLLSGSRTPAEHFAKTLVREGYPGRASAAARALDWRGRGLVRGSDLVALVDASGSESSDGCSTRTAGSADAREHGAHVQAFFHKNKTPTKQDARREARPLSAPAVGARRQPRA